MNHKSVLSSVGLLVLGVGLYTLVTWKWNVSAAAWLAPVFLVRYFRSRRTWIGAMPVALLLCAASWINKAGAWHMDLPLELAACSISAVPMIVSLYLDRFIARRLPPFTSTLIFPAGFVILNYIVSQMPLGITFTIGPTQFGIAPLIQLAAVTGVWGIDFLVLWAASVINLAWEYNFDLHIVRWPVAVYTVCLAGALVFGGLRLVFERPVAETVRVAGVTVAHYRDYWGELIDVGTPQDRAQAFNPEFHAIEDSLFDLSTQAAQIGAKIIFWSEADAFVLPEEKPAFLRRASAFAIEHNVYLMPAFQVLRYGDTSGYNGLALITPQGKVAFEYEKTKSWYATSSDGRLHTVDTPYGRISAAICFYMDFPALIRQAARQQADILLVPAYDTYGTRTYHTEVGLLRGVEDGFSVMRMVNEGTSIAVDARGQVVAWQDFFNTKERLLFADLPTQGTRTIYGLLGDWLVWISLMLLIGTIVMSMTLRRRITKSK